MFIFFPLFCLVVVVRSLKIRDSALFFESEISFGFGFFLSLVVDANGIWSKFGTLIKLIG